MSYNIMLSIYHKEVIRMEYKSLSEAHRRDLTYETLKNGGVIDWSEISDTDRLSFCYQVMRDCKAYLPNQENPEYKPDELVEAVDPSGVCETYSKKKIIDNLSVITGLASRIPEAFYKEDGCHYKYIGIDRDGRQWANHSDIFTIAEFTSLCVASGVLEYTDDPSNYQRGRLPNPVCVRATPGFRQYMQPYSQSAERPGKEEYLKYMQMMNEGIIAPPTV